MVDEPIPKAARYVLAGIQDEDDRTEGEASSPHTSGSGMICPSILALTSRYVGWKSMPKIGHKLYSMIILSPSYRGIHSSSFKVQP